MVLPELKKDLTTFGFITSLEIILKISKAVGSPLWQLDIQARTSNSYPGKVIDGSIWAAESKVLGCWDLKFRIFRQLQPLDRVEFADDS